MSKKAVYISYKG